MKLRLGRVRMNPHPAKLLRDLTRWIEVTYHEEGRLLPLTLALRLGFLLDLLWTTYSWRLASVLSPVLWCAVIVGFGVYLLVLTALAWYRPAGFVSRRSKQVQIILDICFFALFYFINGDPQSNLILAFLLPLLIMARYFSTAKAMIIFSAVVLIH